MYCSLDGKTAVNEIRPTQGKKITILTIGLNQNSDQLNLTEIGCAEAAKEKNKINLFVKEYDDFIKKIGLSKSDLKKLSSLRNLLSNKCMEPLKSNNDGFYKKTVAIGSILMSPASVHGIIYPSVVNFHNNYSEGWNCAIKPSFADAHLYPINCIECIVTGEEYGHKILKPTSGISQINKNGEINWNTDLTCIPSDWQLLRY